MGICINLAITEKNAGSLLLNVGQNLFFNKLMFWEGLILIPPTLFFLAVWIFALLAIIFFPSPSAVRLFWTSLIMVISGWSLMIVSFYINSSEFEIRDNGICYFFWLTKWEKIDSYSWKGSRKSALFLSYNSRVNPMIRIINFPIPRKHKDAVEQVLAQYLPKSEGSKR